MKKTAPFKVYNASAGSGKTFAIVKKYLSFLLVAKRNDAYRNILSITFTNKAVEEMKTRIVDNLTAFSQDEITDKHAVLLESLVAETGLSESAIRKKSKAVLKSLVHNYAAFEVSTIDAFTNRVLRTFAKDLGLSMNYEVELDGPAILSESVDRVIAKAGENKALTKILVNFAISKADEDKSWNIARDLNSIAKLLINENNLLPLEKINEKTLSDFHDFSVKLKKMQVEKTAEAKACGTEFCELMEKNGLETMDFSRGSVPKYFQKLQQEKFVDNYTAAWQTTISEKNLYTGTLLKKSPEKAALIDRLQPQIASLFESSKKAVLSARFYEEIQRNLTQLSLLNHIRQEMETIKENRNLLLISDFNKKIGQSIKNQPAPFIYERLGERYRDYFIDEFQDTSQLQWENLVPLIDNALSGEDERQQTGSLTLVGDAKQSIYRWRGGKAEQFMDLCAGKSPFSVKPSLEKLLSNYRSRTEIVHFNNEFFKHVSQYLSFEPHRELFEEVYQNPALPSGGYVRVSFVEAKNKEERDQVYPEKVLQTVRELESKNYSYDQMCVLVRKKSEGTAVADCLSEHEIPITSSETLLLDNSPKVRLLNSLLAFSLDLSDQNLKLELLYCLWEIFPQEEGQHRFFTKALAAKEAGFFVFLKDYGFHFDLKNFQSLPFYVAMEYALRSFHLLNVSDAYLQFYLDFLFEYTQKNKGGIPGFLETWEQKKDQLSITAPEGQNAVRIMTIHKAKGLEFPIVIYPFVNDQVDDTRLDSVWVPLEPPLNDIPVAYLNAGRKLLDLDENAAAVYQQLLLHKEMDALDTLYVALTRPTQQLHIISELKETKTQKTPNYFSLFLIDFLKTTGKWDETQTEYEFGKLESKAEKTDKPAQIPEGKIVSSSPASHNLGIVTRSGKLWNTDQGTAIDQGSLLHEIMAQVFTEVDLEKALKNSVRDGLIDPKEYSEYEQKIRQIIAQPSLKKYFADGTLAFNEREILCQGEILRPDRVNFSQNKATVIDYKTGKFLVSHEQQINRYAEAIADMGYEIDQKLLVYINDGPTVKIV